MPDDRGFRRYRPARAGAWRPGDDGSWPSGAPTVARHSMPRSGSGAWPTAGRARRVHSRRAGGCLAAGGLATGPSIANMKWRRGRRSSRS